MKFDADTADNAERLSYCEALNRGNLTFWALFVLASVSIVSVYGLGLRTLELVTLLGLLIAAARVDAESFIIPNGIILAGITVRVVFVVLYGLFGTEAWVPLAIRTIAGGLSISVPVLLLALVMDAILGRQSLGGGDIKLLFMVGLFFEWHLNLLALFIACILAVIYGIATWVKNAARTEDREARRLEGETRSVQEAESNSKAMDCKGAGRGRKAMRGLESQNDRETRHDGPLSSPPIPFAVPIATAYWLLILLDGASLGSCFGLLG